MLLLSAALGFGIGFLFNQVGLLARGKVLEGGSYSKEGGMFTYNVIMH